MSNLIIFSIAFSVGIGLEIILNLNLADALWLALICLSLAAFKRLADYRGALDLNQSRATLIIAIFLLGISFGVIRSEIFSWQFEVSPLAESVEEEVELTGVVVNDPDYRANTVQLHIEVGEDKLLVSASRQLDVEYGDLIKVEGTLEEPTSFETDLGKTFDYPGYLLAREIEYRISFAEIAVLESGQGNFILGQILALKHQFISVLEKIIPEPAVGLANGLLLGEKTALGDDIEEDFRRTGIIHIVVLSGYNVMLVVAFIMFCFALVMPIRYRFYLGLLAIISFALMVGLSATVVRASIMASLVLYAQAYGRQYDVLRGLFVAGLIMLIINPYLLLYDIGFQLSFVATLGLILIVPYFETNIINTKIKKLGVSQFLWATIATQIAVFPLLLYHIGEISIISVVVNLLVLPMVPVAMLLSFLTVIVSLIYQPFGMVVGLIADYSLDYILAVAKVFADLPFATISIIDFSAWLVLVSYLFIGGILYYIKNRKNQPRVNLSGWEIIEETPTDDSR